MAEQFQEKFIAYLDILGYSNLVEASEAGAGPPLDDLLEFAAMLGAPHGGRSVADGASRICPYCTGIAENLDFQVTQISDCAIVSAEISPAGAINLVHHCWTAVLGLLHNGLLCRGYITQGKIIHHGSTVIGTGFQRAVVGEKGVRAFKKTAEERGTPFVEVDRPLVDFFKACGDQCAKTMFGRFTKGSDDGVVIFPFQRLSHKFGVGAGFPPFIPEQHLESNNNVRKLLGTLKQRVMVYADAKNPSGMQKIEHYISALDDQFVVADQVEENIERLAGRPIGRKSST